MLLASQAAVEVEWWQWTTWTRQRKRWHWWRWRLMGRLKPAYSSGSCSQDGQVKLSEIADFKDDRTV